MEVKPGYKQTEVGVIPEDWEIATLGELGGTFGGLTGKTKRDFGHGAARYITFMNIMTNVMIDCDTFELVDVKPTETQNQVASGDLFFNGSSETPGEVGMCAILADDVHGVFLNSFCFGFRLREDKPSDGLYLAYYFRSHEGRELMKSLAQGAIRYNLSKTALLKTRFPLPRRVEQEAIAETLSDADALIESLEQLLAKKRQLKQGTMQELITGKKRLPGFSGKWEVKRLGEIAHIKTGGRNNQDKIEEGDYPFFVRSATVERINSYSYDCEAILVPGEGGIGDIFHYICGRFDVHQRVYAITQFSPETSGKFVYFYMAEKFGAHAMQNSVKATVDSLRLPTFQKFELVMPPTVEEQSATAAILSDMDAEIAALETKLAKARQLKQGMMQELLTGRIRLV